MPSDTEPELEGTSGAIRYHAAFAVVSRWPGIARLAIFAVGWDYYPDATRAQEIAKSLANRDRASRFGSEGSEVQVLSPRPIPSKSARLSQPGHSVPLPVRQPEPSGQRFKSGLDRLDATMTSSREIQAE